MPHRPTSELVAIAWLKGVTGIPAANVATRLPKTVTAWAGTTTDKGFLTVQVVAGVPGMYLPVAAPVVMVDCYATVADSEKPPFGRANALAELVRAGTYEAGRVVDLGAAYNDAHVRSAWLQSEPRRIADPDASLARYSLDLVLHWTEVA